tara:strand:+ start:197 stop:775 length:579 start_codon:yes stop_codon:yes gene_type:complete
MGGSKPSPPTIIMPEESNPQAFQTIVPQKSYKDLAESMRRTEKEYNRLVDQRYDTVGTAAEMGARDKGIQMQEAASYLSSLPAGGSPDTSFKETPRAFPIKSNRRSTFDTVPGSMSGFGSTRPGTGTGTSMGGSLANDPAKEAAAKRYEESKKTYAKALDKAKKTPRSFMPETKDPGFAQNPDSMYIPQQIN